MKILLASNGKFSIEKGYKILGISADRARVGYITTASKGAKDTDYLERHKQEMVQAGYSYEEFDIEGKSKEQMLDFFADKNIIHVEGGNTFYLLKAVRESGFDEVLKNLLDRGLTYVGASTGAYIMCPTIEVATWRTGVERRFGVENLTGLGYVPFVLKAHYTDDMQKSLRDKIKTLKYPLRILRDGQGIMVENGKDRFVGEGEEVKFEVSKEIINEIRDKKIF